MMSGSSQSTLEWIEGNAAAGRGGRREGVITVNTVTNNGD
jgi:hypothetical protein